MAVKDKSHRIDFNDLEVEADIVSVDTGGLYINAVQSTATAAEMNYLDITTLGTGAASKAVVLDAGEDYTWPATGVLTYGGTGITASGAEINYLDIATLGTGAASKAVVLDAGDDYTWPATGILTYGVLKDPAATTLTSTAAELNKLDDSVVSTTMVQGAGVNTAESYGAGYLRTGSFVHTSIIVDLSTLIGSATDLHIIGESGAVDCNWGRITTATNGTIVAGRVTCLEVPAGGADDIDFYSSDVATGTQGVAIDDAALGTETALVTSGAAWTLALTKAMTGLPTANDYLYIVSGEAAGGTYTAGKFLIEFFGKV